MLDTLGGPKGHDPINSALLAQLAINLKGTDVRIVSNPEDMAPALTDWRGRLQGTALAILQPGTTAAVALSVRTCAELGLLIVPQGGNTGLCGGATPGQGRGQGQVVLALSRLNHLSKWLCSAP